MLSAKVLRITCANTPHLVCHEYVYVPVSQSSSWLKSRWIYAWVLALDGALDILGGTDEVDLPDILLGWCSALYLLWNHLDPPGDGFVFCALFAVSVVGCIRCGQMRL